MLLLPPLCDLSHIQRLAPSLDLLFLQAVELELDNPELVGTAFLLALTELLGCQFRILDSSLPRSSHGKSWVQVLLGKAPGANREAHTVHIFTMASSQVTVGRADYDCSLATGQWATLKNLPHLWPA